MTLMNLVDEWLLLFRRMSETEDGEIAEGAEDAWLAIEDKIPDKVDGCADFMKELEYRMNTCKAEADFYAKKAEGWKRKHEWMKARIKLAMEKLGLDELLTARHRLKIANNGGAQSVELTTDAIPPEFTKKIERIDVDNDKIRKALLAGEELPFARLKERGTHLRIS